MIEPQFSGDERPVSERGSNAIRRLKKRLFAEQEGLCFYCDGEMIIGRPAPCAHQQGTIDHVIPLRNGGADDESNVVLCCS